MVGSCPSTHLLPPAALPPLSATSEGKEAFEGGPVGPAFQRSSGRPESWRAVLWVAQEHALPPGTAGKEPSYLSCICAALQPSAQTCPGRDARCGLEAVLCSLPPEPLGSMHTQAGPRTSLSPAWWAVGDPACAPTAAAWRDWDSTPGFEASPTEFPPCLEKQGRGK